MVGPRSRKLYCFNVHGAVIAVDPRDQFALENVSTSKKVIIENRRYSDERINLTNVECQEPTVTISVIIGAKGRV